MCERWCCYLGLAVLLQFAAGCTTLAPHHTSLPQTGAVPTCDADPDKGWLPAESCAPLILEHSKDYALAFVEFDDQGWPYRGSEFHSASQQIDVAIDTITKAIQEARRVSIVIFVHGWKHNAAYDDLNVRQFRSLLTGLNHIESLESGCHRRVIGIYAGWRGQALDVDDDLQNVTFWD